MFSRRLLIFLIILSSNHCILEELIGSSLNFSINFLGSNFSEKFDSHPEHHNASGESHQHGGSPKNILNSQIKTDNEKLEVLVFLIPITIFICNKMAKKLSLIIRREKFISLISSIQRLTVSFSIVPQAPPKYI